jgi:hypothetical protein
MLKNPKKIIMTLILFAVLLSLSCNVVHSTKNPSETNARWESEAGGDAKLSWGLIAPAHSCAQYTQHTLKLGVDCVVLSWATAEGWMWTGEGVADSSGTVIGSVYWYQKGQIIFAGLVYGWAYISVKFQAIDVSSGETLVAEKEVLFEQRDSLHVGGWEDFGTWYLESMEIPLTRNHNYKFVLYVKVSANCDGLGGAIGDFDDIFMSDRLIEWGFVDVPHIKNLVTLTVDARDQYSKSVPTRIWIDGAEAGYPILDVQVTTGLHEITVEYVLRVGIDHCTKYTFQHWSDGSADNQRTVNILGDSTYTALYYAEPWSGPIKK